MRKPVIFALVAAVAVAAAGGGWWWSKTLAGRLPASVAVANGRIVWLSKEADLPSGLHADEEIDGEGGWLTPGLIDCHTHLVYAGNRADEFERRLNGESYESIARSGGGIRATVAATRAADEATLYAKSRKRLQTMLNEGVTTVEIKSGYGLDLASERKMLRVARQLGAEGASVRVCGSTVYRR